MIIWKFYYVFLVFLGGVVGCVPATKSPKTDVVRIPQSYSRTHRVDDFWGLDPDFKTLTGIILKKDAPQRIAGFLEELKLINPSYLDHYTLMYNSLSLHGSSYQNPRAIVFGQSGHLILTFNGHPSQEAFGAIEMLEYDLKRGFQFREIAFVKEGGSMEAIDIDPRFSTKFVKVSKPNPNKCTQCHGETNTRPIWESYFLWTGAYGSDDDNLYRWSKEGSKKPSISRVTQLAGEDAELVQMQEFLRGNKESNPRYKQLGNYLRVINNPQLADSMPRLGGSEGEIRPNLVLQNHLFHMTAHSMVKELARNPEFVKWRYAIVDGTNRTNFLDYIPQNLHPQNGELDDLIRAKSPWAQNMLMYVFEQLYRFKFLHKDGIALQLPKISVNDRAALVNYLNQPGSKPGGFTASMEGSYQEHRINFILNSLGHDLSEWAINMQRMPNIRNGNPSKPFVVESAHYFSKLFPNEDWLSMSGVDLYSTIDPKPIIEKSLKALSEEPKIPPQVE